MTMTMMTIKMTTKLIATTDAEPDRAVDAEHG